MSQPYRVTLQGFRPFERSALASYFRLAANRTPAYEQVATMMEAHFLIVDADQAESVAAALATGRQADTVFIGGQAPPGAIVWIARPIDPLHVLRELDAMVEALNKRAPAVPPDAAGLLTAGVRTVIRTPRPGSGESAQAPVPAGVSFVELSSEVAAPAPLARAEALLVDDSEIALRFLETRLQRLGLATARATSSGAALALLARRRFAFVFLDVELGEDSELDGLSLCQHIRRQHRSHAPSGEPLLVFVSAHHNEVDRARGMLAGADAYLGKPLDEAALEKLLRSHGVSAPLPPEPSSLT